MLVCLYYSDHFMKQKVGGSGGERKAPNLPNSYIVCCMIDWFKNISCTTLSGSGTRKNRNGTRVMISWILSVWMCTLKQETTARWLHVTPTCESLYRTAKSSHWPRTVPSLTLSR